MSNTTEHTHVLDVRFLAMPELIRSDAIECTSRSTVQYVDCGSDSLSPETRRHLHALEQTTSHLHDSLVSSLDDPILLWGIWRRRVVLDAVGVAELAPLA